MRTPILCIAAALAFTASAQVPSYIPVNGLVAWYSLNNSMSDAGVNGLTGSVNGTTGTDNRFGDPDAASAFGGSAYDLAPTNALFNTGTGMTVSAWVDLTDASGNQKVIGRTNGSFNTGFILGVQSGQLSPEVWNSSGTHYTSNSGSIPSGTWTQVAITWASSGYLVSYVNGTAVDSIAAGTLPIGSNSEPLVIGGSPWSQSPLYFPVTGSLDDIGIWSRALSAGEMQQVFGSGSTGIAQVASSVNGQVYPNPANSAVTISADPNLAGQHYRVMDVLGKVVRQGLLGNGITIVELDGLMPGVYTVKLGDALAKTLKLVKD